MNLDEGKIYLYRELVRWLREFDDMKIKSGCPHCTGEDPSCNACRAEWLTDMITLPIDEEMFRQMK